MTRATLVLIVLAAPAAWADQVFLAGGGVLNGEIVEQTADSLAIEVGPGKMTVPASRVLRVVRSQSDLAVYWQRAGGLSASDPAGWLELARFAQSRGLLTQAREAYEKVLAADPGNAAANAALGRERVDGQWLEREDAYRARGLVSFDGLWVSPAERAALVAERAAEQRSRELALEASARAREAEARARAAEADARRAEAAAQAAGSGWSGGDWGYGPVYGGGYGGGYGVGVGYGGIYGDGVTVGIGVVHPYAGAAHGYGGPYGGVYGPYGLRHAGHPGVGWPQPVVTPHVSGPRPLRDTGGARSSGRSSGARRR